ncbi:hypothetical protein SAMN05192541_13212 [Bradyrhizobium arachidis]|nr:hypothetical protein SAMN05192541_13212 [Bradyrhizobium arachidis]
MPLSVIWLLTSFAIRLLVVHFKLVILPSLARRRVFGGRAPERAGETSSWLMKTSR